MKEAEIQEAHDAFGKQVSGQVVRVTNELNRLDALLKGGRVDGQVLSEFRQAVDRVRTSGWQVQVWLEGDSRALSVLIVEERIRVATRLLQQLTAEISVNGKEFMGLGLLHEAMQEFQRLLAGKELDETADQRNARVRPVGLI
jgi:hypothetical protein